MRRSAIVYASAFVLAVALDLSTKAYAIAHHEVLVYNDARPAQLPWRLAVSLATTAVAYLFSRRLGPLRPTWACAGVLTGGALSNGFSWLIWPHGVPDFIASGSEAWNVADFEIAFGLSAGVLSIALTAVVRYALTLRRASR